MERQPLLREDQSKDYGMVNPVCVPVEGAKASPDCESLAIITPSDGTFDSIPGYEGTDGGGGFLLPPKPAQLEPEPNLMQQHWNIPSLSEAVAREAFIQFVSSKCCYSSSPAKDGVITNMEAFNTYRYMLETFTESRSTKWSTEPYKGQRVDAHIQPPPGPWDIPSKAPTFFKPDKQEIKVPYTSSMKRCNICSGMGQKACTGCRGVGIGVCVVCNGAGRRIGDNRCPPCLGSGSMRCPVCSGRGSMLSAGMGSRPCMGCNGSGRKVCCGCKGSGRRQGDDRCFHCNGSGRKKCVQCGGIGSQQCATCAGKCQLLVYIQLTIKWKNNTDKFLMGPPTGLQLENLSKVSGQQLFRHSKDMVFPVKNFPDPKVMEASQTLINQHKDKYTKMSRIIQQCHTLELIPVTKVTYTWEENSYVYFVYGNELEVHTDDYPGTCCCSVM